MARSLREQNDIVEVMLNRANRTLAEMRKADQRGEHDVALARSYEVSELCAQINQVYEDG